MRKKYLVLQLQPGEKLPKKSIRVGNLREAKRIARALAEEIALDGASPKWCSEACWLEHDAAPGMKPIGGYDVEGGNAAVIYVGLTLRLR